MMLIDLYFSLLIVGLDEGGGRPGGRWTSAGDMPGWQSNWTKMRTEEKEETKQTFFITNYSRQGL